MNLHVSKFCSVNPSKTVLKYMFLTSSLSINIITKLLLYPNSLLISDSFFFCFIGFSLENDFFPDATFTGIVKNISDFKNQAFILMLARNPFKHMARLGPIIPNTLYLVLAGLFYYVEQNGYLKILIECDWKMNGLGMSAAYPPISFYS